MIRPNPRFEHRSVANTFKQLSIDFLSQTHGLLAVLNPSLPIPLASSMSPYYPLTPRVLVTTTTVFTGPTAAPQQSDDATSSNVPIAPIVAGTCAGVFLAIILVVGWKCWGRSIRLQQQRDLEKRASTISISLREKKTEWTCNFRLEDSAGGHSISKIRRGREPQS